ncbi:flagellar hook protein FlgE [Nitrospira sp.]|nr:flagellar hook protein FlgE [Nitrospira sp.]
MGILTSMFTAVSGLSAYGNAMGIIGNNIANVGTAGFKGSRPAFADLISTSLAGASGTDQAGLGVYLADVQGVFTQGSLTTTGQVLDMAIDGTGFFLLTDPVGTEFYSRNGQFKLDSQGRIVDSNNYLVQGYQANAAGVLTGTIGNITLTNTNIAPSGTSTVNITANLNAASTAPAGAFNATDPTTYNFSSSTTVFDSLGNTHNLQFFFVKSGVANTWNVYQRLDTGAAAAATNLVFNSSGALTSGGAQNFSLAIAGGATTPQAVAVDFTGVTQYAAQSALLDQAQNGFTSGTLAQFAIDSQGQVTAQYTNGRTQLLAQVVLSRFPNPQGLARQGDNVFSQTAESGTAIQGAPASNGLGRIISGAIEQSNVDLGEEFVHMIITQRAFQANSRAITTSDEMLQELVNLKR